MGFLGSEKLKGLLRSRPSTIKGFNLDRVVCGAYELSLGNEIFQTDSKDKKKQILTQNKEQITMNPGQFALLLTQEVINIPNDKIAFISIKAGIKLKGLINVSGFHVDPGFNGKLVFSVYNAGTSPISLEMGEPCFLIWFAELDVTKEEAGYGTGSHEHKNQSNIPTKYIDALIAGELASPSVLSKKIDDVNTVLTGRIGLIERDQTAKDYLIKAALGLGLVIIVKMILDWSSYQSGISKGKELRGLEFKTDSVITQKLQEKRRILIEIDSLTKVKTNINKISKQR